MKWYLKVVRDNYANFEGRARRQEYWMFYLFNMIFTYGGMFVLSLIASALDSPFIIFIIYIYILAMVIPSIAVGVRRMHDVGKVVGIYLFQFTILSLRLLKAKGNQINMAQTQRAMVIALMKLEPLPHIRIYINFIRKSILNE